MTSRRPAAVRQFGNLCSKNGSLRVSCPFCHVRLTLSALNGHVKAVHGVSPQLSCVYCGGVFTWRRGEAQKRVGVMNHRVRCLTEFLREERGAESDAESGMEEEVAETGDAEEEGAETGDMECDDVPCGCVPYLQRPQPPPPSLQGRARLSTVQDSFYRPFGNQRLFEARDGARHVVFCASSGLDHYAYNVFRYFFSGEYRFFHVMVRATLWDKFAKASALLSQLHVLPYSCLCDGGSEHHRHLLLMIRVAWVKTFLKHWKKLHPDKGKGRQKKCLPIKDARHLMNSVWYVSNARASGDAASCPVAGSHYWFERALYPHAKVAMGALWKEGHATVVKELLSNRSTDPFHDHVRDNNRVQLKHVDLAIRNCPIPFEGAELVPVGNEEERPTVFVHGTRMQLSRRRGVPAVTDEAWYAFQVSSRNVMWNRVLEEDYALAQNQTRAYTSAKRLEAAWKAETAAALAKKEEDVAKWRRAAKQRRQQVKRLLAQASHTKREHAERELRWEEESE